MLANLFNSNPGITVQQKRAIAQTLIAAANEQERVEKATVLALAKIKEGTDELRALGVA